MTAVAHLPASELPRRRRRAWPWVLLVVGALLVGAGVAVDLLARDLAEKAIAREVASALEVPDGAEVRVSVGGGPMIVQALSGGLDRVEVAIPGYPLGPLTGDLEIVAQGAPFDLSAPTRSIVGRYAVSAEALGVAAPQLSGARIDGVAIEGDEVVASGNVTVLGASFGLGLGLTPSAVDGDLAFEPTSIRIGDDALTADELRANPFFGGLADGLLQQRIVCVADSLPAALTLSRLEVVDAGLVATFDASGAAIGGDGFRERGSCA